MRDHLPRFLLLGYKMKGEVWSLLELNRLNIEAYPQ